MCSSCGKSSAFVFQTDRYSVSPSSEILHMTYRWRRSQQWLSSSPVSSSTRRSCDTASVTSIWCKVHGMFCFKVVLFKEKAKHCGNILCCLALSSLLSGIVSSTWHFFWLFCCCIAQHNTKPDSHSHLLSPVCIVPQIHCTSNCCFIE